VRLHPERASADPALAMIRAPASVRVTAAVVAAALPLLLLALAILPWQQTATGEGRVIAYAPEERQQAVESPISGRVARWMVREGERVAAGDPIAEIVDNDPDLLERRLRQREAAESELRAVEQQMRSYTAKLLAEREGRDLVVAEYERKIAGLRDKRVGEVTTLDTEQIQLDRLTRLAREGLASQRDLELARMKRDQADASLKARDQEIAATERAREKASAEGDAKVAGASADLEAARTKLAESTRKLLDLEVAVARQQNQVVLAPREGTVLRLHDVLGGGQIDQGDPVATLVPDALTRAVELWVDGNDMPLVRDGEEVRVVFEGWPAVQFAAGAITSWGTFAGRVAFVDATDDGKGKFRVVVLPDPDSPPWPEGIRLPQGVRAKGFVLLGRVSLGYEVWRQVNGFPPRMPIEKGDKPALPSGKKPKAPSGLK
jgi:multidrug resistance efflux pump